MAFKTKVDPFGIAAALTNAACKATADGNSASVAEARDENGTIVAHEVFGEVMAPSADYAVTGPIDADDGDIKLGAVTTYKEKRVVLTNLTINTSAGGEPTMSASGEEVEASSDGTCPAKYSIPGFELGPCHHAKILFAAFSLSGIGCHLQSANYTASCENGKATVGGTVVAHGVYGAKIECQVEIVQTSSTAPTLTAGTGWKVTSPLAETNPDAEYPTFSATLEMPLEMDAEEAASSGTGTGA